MRARPFAAMVLAAILVAAPAAEATQAQQEQKPAAVSFHQPLKEARLIVQRVRLKKPIEVTEEGVKRQVREVLEFRVSSAEPIPVRALDPVLFVGEARVTEYRYEAAGRTLVFTLYDPSKAKDGAEVYLQFGTDTGTRTGLPKFQAKGIKTVRR